MVMGGDMLFAIATIGLICMTALVLMTTSDMKAVKVRINKKY